MRFLIIISILAIVVTVKATTDEEKWTDFKTIHKKEYSTLDEHNHRYQIFKKNLLKIKEQNERYESGESSFNFGITQFADLTAEEFSSRFNGSGRAKLTNIRKTAYPINQIKIDSLADELPKEYDWTREGAVTPIRDDPDCVDCTAETVVGAIEGAEFTQTGKLIQRSPKQLEDCIPLNPDDCWVCLNKDLTYARDVGVMTEEDYPWKFESQPCQFEKINITTPLIQIYNWSFITEGDELELQRALYRMGPIAVALDASMNFQLYVEGVLDDPDCGNTIDDIDTTLLLVGYGESETHGEYWILKNYFGSIWGNNGYLWLRRNKNNQCAVATSAVIPLL